MSFKKHSSRRLHPSSLRIPNEVTSEAVISFYEALDCSKSLQAAILLRYGDFDQLVALDCDPSDYNSSQSFRDAYLACKFLSKSNFFKTTYDRKALALSKFISCEDKCREVNKRFNLFHGELNEFTPHGKLLSATRRKIEQILGVFDPLELFDMSSWGPGVSTLIKGEETFASKKFQFETGITRDLYPLARDLLPLAYPGWWEAINDRFPSFQIGNEVITVPKSSKIDRVIAVEPGINLWFQLGLGRMIRRRLARVGVDLTDQGRNQLEAYSSSKTDECATVDFSSASDTISSGLVETLFSSEKSLRWLEVMDVCRSRYGTIDSKSFRWNKFSSMGNGFTFDLESLIFYAAAVCCCEAAGVDSSKVNAYGDDVIIPSICYSAFCSFSEYLGFSVNRSKSYALGPFRESCGAHYYQGVDCKPVFLEDRLTSLQQLQNFANTVRLRSHVQYGCDARFRRLYYYLVSQVPKYLRFRVPAIVNRRSGEIEPLSGGFLSNFDEGVPRLAKYGTKQNPNSGFEGYYVLRASWVSVKIEVDYPGLLLARLASVSIDEEGNFCPLRGRTRCIVKYTLVQRWYDLGPWL